MSRQVPPFIRRTLHTLLFVLTSYCASRPVHAQTLSAMQGRVFDASGAALPGAIIRVENESTGIDQSARSDGEGRYYVAAIPSGTYTVTATADGFRTDRIDALSVDVGRTLVRDFHLAVGDITEAVLVHAEAPLVDRASATVGHVVTGSLVRQIPLNGRHFSDLGQLVAGSVAPSQNGFSSRPIRGLGSLAFNTAGNREEAVGFVVNGVSTNNLTYGSLIFEPPLGSIQEFKVDNSAFSAEQGHVSGAIVNIVTQSGTDRLHGEGFEFFRNDALDARNFFEFTSARPHPFKRNQFGGSLGGPLRRGQTFFFASYEGLKQHQGVDVNSLVPSDAQRASVTDLVVRQLLPLIPHANFFDANGTPRFVGSTPAVADSNRWTIDLRHNVRNRDRIQAFYGSQQALLLEPGTQGNSIPGFGSTARPFTSILTVNETHLFGTATVNEIRFGRTRLEGGTFPATPLNPASFGIANGVTRPIGLPQIVVGGDLNFGGPGTLPLGRFDTSYVVVDAFSHVAGRHTMKVGGEYRHFINQNFAEGTGVFNFPTLDAFLAGTANAFTITLGRRDSVIDQRAAAGFVQDQITLGSRMTLQLGMRYEWHVTPTERDNRFVVFDPAAAALVRVGVDIGKIYSQNNRNLEPRVGATWSLSSDGRTVLRASYARAVDEPVTTAVRDTAGNPPFAAPLTASGSIALVSAIDAVRPSGLSPMTTDHQLRNASMQSWNVNLQRQLSQELAATVGYSGSRGSNLRISRNINQPIDGVNPFPALSASSPILPGTPLGVITQVESTGFSTYKALWVSLTKRLSRGMQFDTSYTLSKSMDTNSLNSMGFAVQNGYDIASQYGLSDFDARHRFILSASYIVPFSGHLLTRGWQIATVVQAQSGNPVNIVTSNSGLNGLPNTVRPDVTGPIRTIGSVNQWFDTSVFVAANHFGNLGRNVVIGPGFANTDVTLSKDLRPGVRLRVDIFNVLNHPNFGPPGNVVGSPTFGVITRTRLPTGEAGSSRQIQLALRIAF
jgi:hypothetical protein